MRESHLISPDAPLGQVPPVSGFGRGSGNRTEASHRKHHLHSCFKSPHQCVCVSKYPIMILPQVHLRKPCYDFYFL